MLTESRVMERQEESDFWGFRTEGTAPLLKGAKCGVCQVYSVNRFDKGVPVGNSGR